MKGDKQVLLLIETKSSYWHKMKYLQGYDALVYNTSFTYFS